MKNLISIVCISVLLMSCNSEPSLQHYLVDKENSSEFISASLPTNMLLKNLDNLNSEEKTSFEKIKKINVLALPKSKSEAILEEERNELKTILNNPMYESLLNYSSGDKEARLMFLGTEDKIDELIFFGYDSDIGMLLLRMRGDDVNANDIYQITQSAQKYDINSLPNELEDFMGSLNK